MSTAWLSQTDQMPPTSLLDVTVAGRRQRHLAGPPVTRTLTHLADLIAVGTPVSDAMAIAAETSGNDRLESALTFAASQCARGVSLPSALASAAVLDPATSARLAIADLDGDLAGALRDAAWHHEAQTTAVRAVARAVTHTLTSVLAAVMVAAITFTFVSPAVSRLTSVAALPWFTRVLLWAGVGVAAVAVLVATALGVWVTTSRTTSPSVHRLRAALTRVFPQAREVQVIQEYLTWMSTARAGVRAGLDTVTAAAIAAAVTDHAHLGNAWTNAHLNVPADTAHVLAAHLPAGRPQLRDVLALAQQTGQLDQSLDGQRRRDQAQLGERVHRLTSSAATAASLSVAAILAVFCLGVLLPVVTAIT